MLGKKRIAVIVASHNALVCACYLAKAGHALPRHVQVGFVDALDLPCVHRLQSIIKLYSLFKRDAK